MRLSAGMDCIVIIPFSTTEMQTCTLLLSLVSGLARLHCCAASKECSWYCTDDLLVSEGQKFTGAHHNRV